MASSLVLRSLQGLTGRRNKSSLKALSDIFHPELEDYYVVGGCHTLAIHLRSQDHGAKIIQHKADS